MRKTLSFLLAVVLLLSLAPSAYAASPTSLTVVSRKTSTIAPGVTQDIVYSKLTNGEQMVYYTATVDVSQKDVHISAGYKDQDGSAWGLSKTSEQVAAAMKVHTDKSSDRYIEYYNVVAAVNADFYNMQTGQPEGAFAIEGKIIQSANGRTFFAMRKDGTPVIGFGNADWTKYNTEDNPIVDAVGGSTILVQNSVAKPTGTADLNARTAIGITADNKVVMLVTDGKQSPYSAGADMKHLAEILLEAGCVNAINLDGGGSTTYLAKQEGADKISLVSRPCDGSERSTSTGLLIYTTMAPDDTFDHAALTPAHDYVTPNSAVEITAVGVSPAGTSADIPGDAAWTLADSSFGTVANGVFTSNGTVGDAVVQLTSGGEVVGEATIHVVKPDRLLFAQENIAVPYGKSASIGVKAMYGDHEVYYKPEQVTLALSSEALGTLNGFEFTACGISADAPTSGTITATMSVAGLTASADLSLGRGSEVIFDFENDEAGTKPAYFTWAPASGHVKYNIKTTEWGIVTAETGRVHSGKHALALCADWSNQTDYGGCTQIQLDYPVSEARPIIDLTDAVGIGCWLWVPDEYKELSINLTTRKQGGTAVTSTNFDRPHKDPAVSSFEEGGHWFYLYQKINEGTNGAYIEGQFIRFLLYASDTHAAAVKNGANRFVFYVDDITVDYSSVVPDREAPVFDTVYLRPNVNESIAMDKDSVTVSSSGTVSFSAAVADDTTKSNYSGLDLSSAEAFIDGVPVDVSYANGALSTGDITLAAGEHTVRLGIADMGTDESVGNYSCVTRHFSVSENKDIPTVKVVAHDTTKKNIPLGSVYYVDVIATDVSAIESVEMKLDLNDISTWELEHADVDPRFELKSSVQTVLQGDNIAAISISRKPDADIEDRTGEVLLASLPIRAFQGDTEWRSKTVSTWPRDLSVEVDYGSISYVSGKEPDAFPSFSGTRIRVDTEINVWGVSTANSKWHSHTLGTAQDKAPTCTSPGYTGRVSCTVCNSPVTWGTTVPAAGHKWAVAVGEENANAGKMCCEVCGKLLTGEYDGKTYKDGDVLSGWVEDSYYIDGVKKTAEFQEIEGKWYQFTDGACKGKTPYTGFFEQTVTDAEGKETVSRYCALAGILCLGDEGKDGWFSMGEERCHACAGKGGALGTVTIGDSRTCTQDGYKFFSCSCGKQEMSEALWAEGHKWNIENPDSPQKTDPDNPVVCTVCKKVGKNIGDLKITFNGDYFLYTGKPVPAAYVVEDETKQGEDKTLSILSDKRGKDGLATYSNHTNVGKGTLTILGRGDYYGMLTGTFTIIPGDIPELRVGERNQTSVKLKWDEAPGAEYYAVYQRPVTEPASEWTFVKSVYEKELEITGLSFGQTYEFRAASRVTNPDDANKPYVGPNWTSVSVNMAHDWGDYTVVDATCTVDGSKTRTCANCGEEDVVVLPALGHAWGELAVETAPTCEADGVQRRSCTREGCGEKSEPVAIAALGHDVKEWETVKEPTSHAKGEMKGTCTREDCGKTVTKDIPTLNSKEITVAEPENGTVTVDPDDKAAEGETVTIKVYPDEGYKLDEITVKTESGEAVDVSDDGTFTMPAEPVTVAVSFVHLPYAITVTPADNGTVFTAPSGEANAGQSVTLSASPEEGYELVEITVVGNESGDEITIDKDGAFTMPDEDVTVSASFQQIKTYAVAVSSGEHGTAATDPAGRAAEGTEVKITTKPADEHFAVDQVEVSYADKDGEKVSVPVSGYAFTMPAADVSVSVTFKQVRFDVTAEAEGCILTPKGSESPVRDGESYSFTVRLKGGYRKGSGFAVKANGELLTAGEGGVYTISNIRGDQAITVEGVEVIPECHSITLPEPNPKFSVLAQNSVSPVERGKSYSFTVKVAEGYSDSFTVKANGQALTAGVGGVYTVSNITEPQEITVEGVERITYDVNLVSGTGYEVKFVPGSSAKVEYGGSVSFAVSIDEGFYPGAGFDVSAEGNISMENGIYTISDIRGNQTVTVEGVEKTEVKVETVPPKAEVAESISDHRESLENAIKNISANLGAITKAVDALKELVQAVENVVSPPEEGEEKPVEELKVKVSLDIKATEYTPAESSSANTASLTLDIKPVYTVVKKASVSEEPDPKDPDEDPKDPDEEAPVEDPDVTEEEVVESKALDTTSFHEDIEITVPLPNSFFTGSSSKWLIVKHYGKDGNEIMADRQLVKAEDNAVTFKARSFSNYELVGVEDPIEVTYDVDGVKTNAVFSSDDVDKADLLNATKASQTVTYTDQERNEIVTTTTTYTLDGWEVDGELYKTEALTDELFEALKSAKYQTLVAHFSEDKSTESVEIGTPDAPQPEAPTPTNPGSSGGSSSSAGTTSSNTTTNSDGSTTRTETKPDGTTVETTTKTDGSRIETITKPDGSKSVEVKQADGTTASATVSSDGKTEAEVKLSETAVQQAAGSSIVLPIPEVKADRSSGESSSTVKVSLPQSDRSVRVTVPVAEIKSGDVAVIVNPDGSETVVKKSAVTEDGLSIPLESGATIKIVDNSKEFKDTGSHWSHDAVSFVTSRELFLGVSEDSFAPNAAMDRAMLVTVLHRLEDLPAGGQVQFTDVKGGNWYSEAVAWASEKNIVTGYGNGYFGPNEKITREQIAVILYRYAATQNIDTNKRGSLSAFADASSTSSWAQESMSWAVSAGLFQGSGGRLEPQKSATRAEVAVILQRFVEYTAAH